MPGTRLASGRNADMTSIASISSISAAAPASSPQSGGDLLGAMRPAMDRAFAIGAPTTAGAAAGVLATGASYLNGAQSTLNRLDEGIARRRSELDAIGTMDPKLHSDKLEQLDLLQRLRDRIQLSIERVSDILAGRDRDDIGTDDDAGASHRPASKQRRRQEQLDELEQRRQLLATQQLDATATASSQAVANAYAGNASS